MLKSILASFVLLIGIAFSSSNLMAAILDDTFKMTNLSGKKIGYYTGSFDPIHLGHQHVIDAALRNGYVDYILVYPVPGGDSFKNRSELGFRQKMIASIYQDNSQVLVTYWTPKEIQDRFSKVADNVEVIGIIGSDVVTEKLMGPDILLSRKCRKVFMRGVPLEEKHFYDTVGAIIALKAGSFVVALRDGVDLSYLNDKIYDRPILGFISSTGHSSTEVREAIGNKQRFEHLVSFPVQALIKQEGMYGYMTKEGDSILNDADVEVRKSTIGQFEDGLGVFATKDFKKGEVVFQWNLQVLTREEYDKLSEYEKNNFCRKREGVMYHYPIPERYVNRSDLPNVLPDFEKQADIALRDIKKGEELSIPATFVEDY